MRVWLVFSSIYAMGWLLLVIMYPLITEPDATYAHSRVDYAIMLAVGAMINYTCIATLNYIVRGKVTLWYKDL